MQRSFGLVRTISRLVTPSPIYRTLSFVSTPTSQLVLDKVTDYSNVTDHILQKLDIRLHQQPDHPLGIIKQDIFSFFEKDYKCTVGIPDEKAAFDFFDDLHPVVTVNDNFENLLTPPDHPSRQKDESYYLSENELLRCHMTAHQRNLLSSDPNRSALLFAGDVYRRDTVDSTHSPVFHQLDGVKVYKNSYLDALADTQNTSREEVVSRDMKNALENLVKSLFGDKITTRWVDAYFPFTEPSWELEILFNEKSSQIGEQTEWLEVLGCGIMRKAIMDPVRPDCTAWAFGLGLERLAMILYNIPDIRLFWSKDPRFLNQFKRGKKDKFIPFSKFPPCYKDITFWITDKFTDNSFCEIVRESVGDIVESVELLDHFVHPKTQRESKCFRLNYRSMEKSLVNHEVNVMQEDIRNSVVEKLGVELR